MKIPPVRFGVRPCAFFVPLTYHLSLTCHAGARRRRVTPRRFALPLFVFRWRACPLVTHSGRGRSSVPVLLWVFISAFPLFSVSAFAQGSLTPPGTPAPTMKTLDQIEPRKEVNATNTPGDGTSLFIISVPGSYYLSGNISGVSGKHGIRITTTDVTLDLNGFVLTGVSGSLDGISVLGGGRNLAIRNGTVRDWGTEGVDFAFAFYPVLEDLRLYRNGSDGLKSSGGSIIRGCTASYNVGSGFNLTSVSGNAGSVIEIADEAVVENCFATGNGGNGFTIRGATITKCEARLNSGNGISASLPNIASTLTACQASANVGDGITAGDGSTLTNCTAKDNSGTNGILTGDGSTLTGCTAYSNDVAFGIQAGDRSTLTNCTASVNTDAAADSRGISAGAQCTISNCTASGNLNTNGTPSGSTGGGILAGGSSTVQNCTVVGNKGDGIQIAGDSRVVENNCDSNGFGGGDAAGIHSTGADNRIEGNNVTDNTRGIDVDSSGSLIIKNSASGSTGGAANNYTIAAGNADAAIETPGAAFTSTNPWANFSY
jgi:parallel beta-helix repeat protein